MTKQERAILALARSLRAAGVQFMLIGGHAATVWGRPRATLDVDVTIWATEDDLARLLEALAPEFEARVGDPRDFVRDTRVLPLRSRSGVPIDLIFGLLPFEQQAIDRARAVDIAGEEIPVVSAEDLVLMKIISDRPRDLEDVRAVVDIRFEELDLEYLEPRIHALAEALDNPEIARRWAEFRADWGRAR